ncbi:putative metallophosphoesterase [Flavobacterium sp. ACN2]|uniref:metallophosphoesterase n=1 Tax=Flavobacterium sp. ACN2 TaxID=1975676 RepID=UPI000BB2DF24|nr:metallophosphoesterase [Flavobacterium sp. ACN2]PBI93418.1 putative metallophosphoesterase [Flavobacterium sp. ACN2]
MIFRFIILCALLLFIEFYSYQAFRTLIKARWVLIGYQVISLLVLIFIIYSFSQVDRSVGQTRQFMFTTGLMLVVYVPKIVLTLIMFGEDIIRIGASILNYFVYNTPRKEMMPDRRKFVSQIALGLAAIPFLSIIYGIFEGKYNFKVIKQTIFFPDLPDAFDGFKITQISDVHSGSFDNPEKINYAIDLINAQEADLILFTGDIVNTHAKEMHPWLETFNRIKDYKYGKFAVLGNHDYGEYVTWPSEKEKDENFKAIKDLYGQIGFKLMLNEHTYIQKGDDKIALIGVENWGVNFKKAGDLNKASENVHQDDFKVLMSHDPSHWDAEIKDHPKNFHLTFAGHTHGMQFGIEIPGYFKWSLAQYIYKQWAGLYENVGKYVYVNRGFGFHAYPGRVGIMPEITVIELKKGRNVA